MTLSGECAMDLSLEIPGDTIVAVSTPRGFSGVGVIRLTGPAALPILRKVFRPAKGKSEFPSRRVVYGRIWDLDTEQPLDDGLALFMKGPNTYTGEDMVELSLHGSPTILDLSVETIVRHGARLAARGEFTRRAFLAGKLDLVQAEAVIDFIESTSPISAQEARARRDKTLSNDIQSISNDIKDLLSEIEACIDFDEDEEGPRPEPAPTLRRIVARISTLRTSARAARIRREGVNIIITGKPNVGKSTLFNALIGTDRTIVTPYPGTTRDTVEERLLLGGLSFVLCDTAGIRRDPEPIEEEGIRRTREQIKDSDLVVVVLDGSASLDEEDSAVLEAVGDKEAVIVLNKMDLGLVFDPREAAGESKAAHCVPISAKTGEGLDMLKKRLTELGESKAAVSTPGAATGLNSRGLLLINAAAVPIEDLIAQFDQGKDVEPEIVSFELRRSLEPLQEITGEKVDEGVLDRIFERFCVGK